MLLCVFRGDDGKIFTKLFLDELIKVIWKQPPATSALILYK
jgi:hypothetical protein